MPTHDRYKVYVNDHPQHFKTKFKVFLYNTKQHTKLLADSDQVSTYYLADHDKKEILALIHFFINNNVAESLMKRPFGGLEHSHELSEDLAFYFISELSKDLHSLGIQKIRINCYPAVYFEYGRNRMIKALFLAKYNPVKAIPNHHIEVGEGDFEDQIRHMQLRKLRKCLDADFRFCEEPMDRLAFIYDFILKCRKEKRQSLSMTYKQLEVTVKKFPSNFKVFSVTHNDIVVAATVVVKVSDDVLYHFYPASLLSYNAYSPMILLSKGLYSYCKMKGIRILDLGTSFFEGKPQYSLIDFKESIGGKNSLKYFFELK